MNILQSWKQSLSLFGPAHFAQFVRDVIRVTFETYTILCTQWRAIAVLLIYMLWRYIDFGILLPYVLAQGGHGEVSGITWVAIKFLLPIFLLGALVLFNMFLLLICMAARSSRSIKDNAYFQRYSWYFIPLILVALGLYVLEWDQVFFFPDSCRMVTYGIPFTFILRIAEPTLLLMSVFFFLDSDGTWYQLYRSVLHAGKMVLYNIPLFALLLIVMLLVIVPSFQFTACLAGRTDIGAIFIPPLLWNIVYSIIIALGATLYTKMRHAQPDLYID